MIAIFKSNRNLIHQKAVYNFVVFFNSLLKTATFLFFTERTYFSNSSVFFPSECRIIVLKVY